MDNQKENEIIHANFFFIDAISSSDPNLSTKMQLKKIRVLNQLLETCPTYQNRNDENFFLIPTGDGMCIGFLQGIDLPLKLAIELHNKINEYNAGKIPADTIQTRIGLNSGESFPFVDFKGNKMFWGPGIIIAKRIMDLGDDGHILLSQTMGETLRDLSNDYRKIIKPVRDYDLKHGLTMLVYSAYGIGFGNRKPPRKNDIQKRKTTYEIEKLQNSLLYPKIHVEINLKNTKSMLVHHRRSYEISNISNEPINFILHGIATDIERDSINDLNIRVYDNENKEMKISSINYDKPLCKEFSTKLNTPVIKNEKGRSYTLEYEVEEPKRFYENAFLVDCKEFIVKFNSPENFDTKNVLLYEVNQENDQKIKLDIKPEKKDELKNKNLIFKLRDIVKGQTIRLEW